MSTVYCNQCSVQLSYPAGSLYIQCPKCGNVMNPQAPQQTTCIACNTLLAHPPSSLYIQCPKCLTIMNTGDRTQQQHPQQQQAPPAQHLPAGQMMQAPRGTPNQGMTSTPLAGSNDFKQAQNQAKPKKKRDPHAPKAASNAYMIFCKEMRPVLKKENTELSFGKIGAKLGEMWRNLSAEGKKPYEDRAAADRERYRKEMENYQNAGGVIDDDEPALKKSKIEDSEDDEKYEDFADGSNFQSHEHLQTTSQGYSESQHLQQQQFQYHPQTHQPETGIKSSPLHNTAGLSSVMPMINGQQSPTQAQQQYHQLASNIQMQTSMPLQSSLPLQGSTMASPPTTQQLSSQPSAIAGSSPPKLAVSNASPTTGNQNLQQHLLMSTQSGVPSGEDPGAYDDDEEDEDDDGDGENDSGAGDS